jgi:hypothetical protein
MKIAIMIPGHLRTWEIVKPNFIKNALNSNHQVDVFVDTYNEFFRRDYDTLQEKEIFKYGFIFSDEKIKSMFDGINVVDFKIEKENSLGVGLRSSLLQVRKLKKIYESVKEYEKVNGEYDLYVRLRPDNEFDEKVNYDYILAETIVNPKKIFIGQGGAFNFFKNNDMLAIARKDAMDIYMNRFSEWPYVASDDGGHIIFNSMEYIADKYGIEYDQSVEITAIKVEGVSGKWFKFKHGSNYGMMDFRHSQDSYQVEGSTERDPPITDDGYKNLFHNEAVIL